MVRTMRWKPVRNRLGGPRPGEEPKSDDGKGGLFGWLKRKRK